MKYPSITEKDLYIAYKKAKFELFNDKNTIATISLFRYERELKAKIEKLFKEIQENGLQNIKCSDYYEIPKSMEIDIQTKVHFFSSSLEHHKINENQIDSVILKFRKVIDADIDFHIVSALWIAKVGQYIDEKFGKNIYGSRLIRIKPAEVASCEFDFESQPYNLDSPRVFEPYQHKYQSWKGNSFKAIRALHKSSSVIAITMDITSFFHSVILDEFKTETFYAEFGLIEYFQEYTDLKAFHEEFIELLELWNQSIASKDSNNQGLPIGLSASPILANAVMKEFDQNIEALLAPTYYGRYVDDILLVFPDNGNISNGEDVLKYLIAKQVVQEQDNVLQYKNFDFKKEKQKIFYLDKNADLSIIDAIEAEINSVSSEWRFMPDLADENSSFIQKIVGFYTDGTEFNDALRKVDSATIKRLGLSILISHSHALNQFIAPKEWQDRRLAIYDLIENHIFIPKNFFDNFSFIPKIFRLMVHSGDGERAFCFLEKVFDQTKRLNEIPSSKFKASNGNPVEFNRFKRYVYFMLQQVFIESFNIRNTMSKRHSTKIIRRLFHEQMYESHIVQAIQVYNDIMNTKGIIDGVVDFENIHMPVDKPNEEVIHRLNTYLFKRDLSFDGYAETVTEYILTKDNSSLFTKVQAVYDERIISFDIEIVTHENFLKIVNHFAAKIVNVEDKISNLPLIFPTRVFSALDISIISRLADNKSDELYTGYVNCLRGTHSERENKINTSKSDDEPKIIHVPVKNFKNAKSVQVAITNFEVPEKYWKQSVIQKPVKDALRYKQLQDIVKEAVKKRPNYLILPELAIPQEWAWRISKKLLANNISLISGVEYIHTNIDGNKIVNNALMLFLIADDIGFKYMKFFRQDKTFPAHDEAKDLKGIANITLKADDSYKKKYVYRHGNFYFSCLICNELTDIENRMKLRGNIDALVIVEWNRDIKSFNALVESASLDIHSYVVQVNNRLYGDSRIRAPHKEDYFRDVVQVKGGNHDYLIVGEIAIEKLREFQSYNISPSDPYKPVPTGFKMLDSRKEWKNEITEDKQ
jgi:hypothetical protein